VALENALAARKRAGTGTAMIEKIYAQTRYAVARTQQERDEAVQFARDSTARFPSAESPTGGRAGTQRRPRAGC